MGDVGTFSGRFVRAYRRWRSRLGESQIVTSLQNSGLFDEDYYLQTNPDVAQAGVDPLRHYVRRGRWEGRAPSERFDPKFYLVSNPDVERAGVEPLSHYLRFGRAEGRLGSDPNPPSNLRTTSQVEFDSPLQKNVTVERMAGSAYFEKSRFSLEPGAPLSRRTADAVAELASRSPNLNIEHAQPKASILIPVYGQLPFVLNCLDSLSRQASRYSAEIIVLDDNSPESTETQRLAAVPWIRYVKRDTNGGFIEACNYAAGVANGEYLIFLNSDTRVVSGWLDELLDSFELFPKAGLIGSKLLNEDGTLQEAGGIFWRDGSAWNYGRNEDPNHPKYCFARRVDYVSGASIAVPARIWREMGGFDTAYRPAYCEDSDLAFRLREAGYEVWLQPLSCVIHYEGKTHGRDLSQGGKAHQIANMKRFAERWKHTLASCERNGEQPDKAANRTAKARVLFIDATTPRPDHDAGSIFTFKILRAFQELGYEVLFVPQTNYCHDGQYTEALQRLGIECFYHPFFRSITEVIDFRNDIDVVFACRVTVLDGIYDELREKLPTARIIFENADLHYLREEREAILYGDRNKRIRAAVTKAAELELMAKVDCSVVHTRTETNIIRQELPLENIVEIPAVYDAQSTRVPFEDRYDIIFLGGFGHPPNTDAVRYFATSIWPLVTPHLPERARFVIVGAQPGTDILSLESDRVVVTGFVHDLRPYFDSARVFVAPLRYGAGIKGKVIQSLCYGTPSVVTSMAAEGIGLVSGRDTLIADGDSNFANSVLMAYFNRSLWHSLQLAGYEFVERNYSWKRCLELLTNALDTADAEWLRRHEQSLRIRLAELISNRAGKTEVAAAVKRQGG